LEALSTLGINQEELYKLSFEKFKNQNSDIQELPKDLQKYRYEAYEKFRNKTIEKLKEERKNIIENQGEDFENEEEKEKEEEDPKMKRIIQKQKDTIQKIKNKQKHDIQGMIEASLQKEMMNKNAADKERERKEREKEAAEA